MILFLLAYLGGVLTIVSPCILPVLPFVFARADRPFIKSGLPMLAGMAVTFALIATLAAVGGGWAVQANQYGRYFAIALLAAFGVVLLFPHLSDQAMRPLVALGARLSETAAHGKGNGGGSVWASVLLGVATGLLWAPCAGPVLGLILTGAALQGASVHTTLLLVAYAAGAATSLALALLVGGRIFVLMKRGLGVGEWVRRGLGVLVLGAVVVIALGLDTGVLTRVSAASTASLEQNLLDRLQPEQPKQMAMADTPKMSEAPKMSDAPAMSDAPKMSDGKPEAKAETLPVEGTLPSLAGATGWINSTPLTAEALKGKVVLIDFWTYSCINCLRSVPYVEAWAEKYRDQGLVVIGVHAPEFAFERDLGNIKKAVADLHLTYPVAVDNDYAIWRGFDNHYWPAHYFIDAQGRIRHHHYGEGKYDESEKVIQQLLAEAGKSTTGGLVAVKAGGAQAAADTADVKSPETYVNYERGQHFVSPEGANHDEAQQYSIGSPMLNEWSLGGEWVIGGEHSELAKAGGAIVYRFHARDLHLVLGPSADGKPVRFQVMIDGAAPGAAHGTDADADGNGTVTAQRLYQLIRQPGAVADHTFEIKFLDPGVQAFAFTFG